MVHLIMHHYCLNNITFFFNSIENYNFIVYIILFFPVKLLMKQNRKLNITFFFVPDVFIRIINKYFY